MTEISHLQLADFLKKASAPSKCVYLVHGEPTLVDQCIEPLTTYLLQGASREMSCESVDGLAENIGDMLAQLNTFSMLAGAKVVLFRDAKLFDARGDQQRIIDQIRDAYDADRLESAAKAWLGLLRHHGLGSDDITPERKTHPDLLPLQEAVGEDTLRRLIQLCAEKGWRVDPAGDPIATLMQGIEKGFPARHFLVITSYAKVPKNRKLYKTIAKHGWIIDCAVPLGEKKADKTAQEAVLRQTMERMLAGGDKKMAPALFAKLTALTGFDLPVFIQNLEKLITYIGDRKEITAADMDTLVRRTKLDPIFELTNAMADRNAARAVSFLQGLLKADWHPLQILAALTNQVRKLLVAKDFTASKYGVAWSPGISYPQFQDRVLPAIKDFDAAVEDQIAAWDPLPTNQEQIKQKAASKKKRFDLALAANPYNAYPIYQTLLKSEKFTSKELLDALMRMSQVDVRLKSSARDPAVMLTTLLLAICRK